MTHPVGKQIESDFSPKSAGSNASSELHSPRLRRPFSYSTINFRSLSPPQSPSEAQLIDVTLKVCQQQKKVWLDLFLSTLNGLTSLSEKLSLPITLKPADERSTRQRLIQIETSFDSLSDTLKVLIETYPNFETQIESKLPTEM